MKRIIFICLLILIFTPKVFAQELILTWKSSSYVPNFYESKIYPSADAPISVYADLLDGSKIKSLGGATVTWYVDGKFYKSGKNLRSIAAIAPPIAGGFVEIRAETDSDDVNTVSRTIKIPIVSPKIAIDAPYAGNSVYGNSFALSINPFFFSVGSPAALNFAWTINGRPPQSADDPQILKVAIGGDYPRGSSIRIRARARNPRSTVESAENSISLVPAR